MAETRRSSGEQGTTLVELLVVVMLLGIIGTVTTVGLVASFRTQLTATRGAETLDEIRLSVQRMRDVIRGADEVCASSTSTRLALWTDRDDAGSLGDDEDVEVTIFEIDTTTNQLTGTIRNSGSTTLISDVLVTAGPVFTYDVEPTSQETDLVCLDGATVSGGTAATTRVDLDIEVENGDGEDTIETTTSMRLRNAGLADATSGGGAGTSNDPPSAAVTLPSECIEDQDCQLVGDGSDPESGPLTYAWDLDNDGAYDDASVKEPLVQFPTPGTVPVKLQVTDDQGQSATASGTIEVLPAGANEAPVAAFTYDCKGATCNFDADSSAYPHSSESGMTESSDAEDAQSALSYDWTFNGSDGSVTTLSGPDQTLSFAAPSTTVTLRVTDTNGAFDASQATLSTTASTIRVASLRSVGGPKTGGSFTATLTIKVTTTADVNRADAQVSVDIANASVSTGTCTTASTGTCDITVTAVHNQTVTFTVNTVSDAGAGTYDAGFNLAETIQATKDTTRNEP